MIPGHRGRVRGGLVLLLILPIAVTGCLTDEIEGFDPEERLQFYHVVMHEPYYEWNPENQTLSGNLTLSNIEPPGMTRTTDETEVTFMVLSITYIESPVEEGSRGPVAAEWGLEWPVWEEVVIENGETWVFNFSVTPDPPAEELGWIKMRLMYVYTAMLEEGPDWKKIDIVWRGPCLVPDGGELVSYRDSRDCQPYGFGDGLSSRYDLDINEVHVPPVEYWDQWGALEEEAAPLVPVREYLQGFRYSDANITYFEGRISCSGCLTGGQ